MSLALLLLHPAAADLRICNAQSYGPVPLCSFQPGLGFRVSKYEGKNPPYVDNGRVSNLMIPTWFRLGKQPSHWAAQCIHITYLALRRLVAVKRLTKQFTRFLCVPSVIAAAGNDASMDVQLSIEVTIIASQPTGQAAIKWNDKTADQ